uniref:Uncharacterized protein TCIL3000_8_7760 n=1 Tax=Trypanosoma congolense (strain IL3000) TaxID=1068625 RepID=G0UT33_TRYCI|nr:unnamed protein product [Trypanosoma congolense IL3000]
MISEPAVKELLSSVKYILLDVDGVVWSGPLVLPKIPETLRYLRSIGKQVRFVTNNASISRASLAKKFKDRGIEGVRVSDVYNSGYAAALRLRSICGGEDGLVRENIFVVGEEGLHDELRQMLAPGYVTYGLELHDAEAVGGYNSAVVASAWKENVLRPPQQEPELLPSGEACKTNISLADLSPGAVVVGLDTHFNMLKLSYASLCLQKNRRRSCTAHDGGKAQKHVHFIATNMDPQIPIGEEGVLLPGAGSMVAAVSTASGRQPDVVCGKPCVDLAKALFEAEGITDPRQCLMVGDRLTTDIAFGNAAGCRTLLVLSGVESLEDVARVEGEGNGNLLPEFIAPSLAVLLPGGCDE